MIYDVAVVGTGFSAISLVTNLLLKLPSDASIAIIGDDADFGRGTAYRTELHLHRLNVPAARMSAFTSRPSDFVEWLARKGRHLDGDGFASRNDYGLYLRDTLASLLRAAHHRARVDFVKAKAINCAFQEEGIMMFRLSDGGDLRAVNVALCLGVGTASLPRLTAVSDRALLRRVVRNPWKLSWFGQVRENDTVAILGSGLTMIDQVLSLRNKGHRGKIHVLSRRGLAPHAHSSSPVVPVAPEADLSKLEISQIVAALRAQVRGGAEWRAVMDGLRPRTQALWQGLNQTQRSRFLRHALAWWNIHRHRVAPQVHEAFDALVCDGTVTIHAGFVSQILREDERNTLLFRHRGRPDEARLTFEWLINCTGMEHAGITHSPLLQNMKTQSLLEADDLGLGICVDDQSQLVCRDGTSREGLFALGALTAGQFWEITAVPDIRVQSDHCADTIARRVRARRKLSNITDENAIRSGEI